MACLADIMFHKVVCRYSGIIDVHLTANLVIYQGIFQ